MEPQPFIKDGIEGTYGRYYSPDELIKECLKDRGYYEGKLSDPSLWKIRSAKDIEKLPGGVTFSGGEALLQMERLVLVVEELHRNDVNIAVETALFVNPQMIELAIQHIDFFYVDMKILDKNRCKEVEKGDLGLYISNLDMVLNSNSPVVIRVPVIGGYTDNLENRKAVKELIGKYKDSILKVELIKEHNLGASKYKSLGMELSYKGVEEELMERYKAELDELGIAVEICKI